MAGFTVVGASRIEADSTTDPQSHSVPLPSGTMVGDLLVVGLGSDFGTEVTDSRLSTISRTGLPSPYSSGAWGVATDLSDVTVTMYGYRQALISVLALRDVVGVIGGFGAYNPPGWPTDVAAAKTDGFTAAVVMVSDATEAQAWPTPVDQSIGDDVDWTTEDYGVVTEYLIGLPYSGFAIKAFTYVGADPVPELSAQRSPDALGRRVFVLLFNDPAPPTARGYLRQRQSPRNVPTRARQGSAGIRQRQRWL